MFYGERCARFDDYRLLYVLQYRPNFIEDDPHDREEVPSRHGHVRHVESDMRGLTPDGEVLPRAMAEEGVPHAPPASLQTRGRRCS